MIMLPTFTVPPRFGLAVVLILMDPWPPSPGMDTCTPFGVKVTAPACHDEMGFTGELGACVVGASWPSGTPGCPSPCPPYQGVSSGLGATLSPPLTNFASFRTFSADRAVLS